MFNGLNHKLSFQHFYTNNIYALMKSDTRHLAHIKKNCDQKSHKLLRLNILVG